MKRPVAFGLNVAPAAGTAAVVVAGGRLGSGPTGALAVGCCARFLYGLRMAGSSDRRRSTSPSPWPQRSADRGSAGDFGAGALASPGVR